MSTPCRTDDWAEILRLSLPIRRLAESIEDNCSDREQVSDLATAVYALADRIYGIAEINQEPHP